MKLQPDEKRELEELKQIFTGLDHMDRIRVIERARILSEADKYQIWNTGPKIVAPDVPTGGGSHDRN